MGLRSSCLFFVKKDMTRSPRVVVFVILFFLCGFGLLFFLFCGLFLCLEHFFLVFVEHFTFTALASAKEQRSVAAEEGHQLGREA